MEMYNLELSCFHGVMLKSSEMDGSDGIHVSFTSL